MNNKHTDTLNSSRAIAIIQKNQHHRIENTSFSSVQTPNYYSFLGFTWKGANARKQRLVYLSTHDFGLYATCPYGIVSIRACFTVSFVLPAWSVTSCTFRTLKLLLMIFWGIVFGFLRTRLKQKIGPQRFPLHKERWNTLFCLFSATIYP